jgi:hypothetical protein
MTIISENKADHTRMLNSMEKTMKKYNLNINVKKTNIRVCGKNHMDKITIILGHHKIAQVEEF